MRFVTHLTYAESDPNPASAFLAAKTGLSKAKVKRAMGHGAVWLNRVRQKPQRLRRTTRELKKGDGVSIYYDEALLALTPPQAQLIADFPGYSVWYKPSGLLAQGTSFGDHCSLLRQVELHFALDREVFLLHRLDREASGLMLVAHNRPAAAKLSQLFQDNGIEKSYRLEVCGELLESAEQGSIDLPLDDKPALTRYRLESYHPETDTSIVLATLVTGRTHQLRRHFAAIGHPLIGDPRYGRHNKNSDGLRLVATGLNFICPLTSQPRRLDLADTGSGTASVA